MNVDEKCIKVMISGRVQGVWFRGWIKETAQVLKLRGWAKNMRDGSVEAVFCGPKDEVDRMVNLCYKGPRLADIKDVEVVENYEENPTGFEILRSE